MVRLAVAPERGGIQIPLVIETMLGEQRELSGLGIKTIETGLTGVDVLIDKRAISERQQCALDGHKLRTGVAVGVLVQEDAGDCSVFTGVDGDRWHQDQRVVIDEVHLGVAIAVVGDHAAKHRAIAFDECARQIDAQLATIEIAQLRSDFSPALGLWRFGNHVDDTAGRTLTIEHRSGTAQYFYLLDGIHLSPGRVVAAKQLLDGIAIPGQLQSPRADPVTAGRETKGLSGHTGHVRGGLREVLCALLEEGLSRFDRQRSRSLNNRCG